MDPIAPLMIFLFWLFGYALLWRIPNPSEFEFGVESPLAASIIIPARNEAAQIAGLLRSLKDQTVTPLEIILVDDHSEDSTAAVARAESLKVISSEVLPEGWAGKPWACWQGARRAAGDILVFLDADTVLEPDGLAHILKAYRRKGGLLSVHPFHRMLKAYERLSAFFNIVAMAGMQSFTILGDRLRPPGAFGPCMACSRVDYFAVEGHSHEMVRGKVLESLDLGKAFMKAGLPVHCYGGKGTVSFRMYPDGLLSLIEGFGKGFGTGAAAMSLGSLVLTVGWITGCFSVTRHLFQSAFVGHMEALTWFIVLYGFYVAQIQWMLRRIGNFGFLTALLFPMPLTFFGLVFAWSLVRTFLVKKVLWKGRILNTNKKRV
jgi:4,4'-diaponeurosporenoate glycosyltransferase